MFIAGYGRLSMLKLLGTTIAGIMSISALGFAAEFRTNVSLEAHAIGALKYRGGFVDHAAVALTSPMLLKAFKAGVPEFCQGVDVIEAGVTVDGIDTAAVRSDREPKKFIVNKGVGVNTSVIWLSLNGPVDAQCDIPLLLAEPGDDITPPVAGPDGEFLNNASQFALTVRDGKIVSSNLQVSSQSGRFQSMFLFEAPLVKSANGDVYTTTGSIGIPIDVSPRTAVLCPTSVSLELTYQPIYPQLTFKITLPSEAHLGQNGQCVFGPLATDTFYLQRQRN